MIDSLQSIHTHPITLDKEKNRILIDDHELNVI